MNVLERYRLRNKSIEEKKAYFERRILDKQSARKDFEFQIARLNREIKDLEADLQELGD